MLKKKGKKNHTFVSYESSEICSFAKKSFFFCPFKRPRPRIGLGWEKVEIRFKNSWGLEPSTQPHIHTRIGQTNSAKSLLK